MLDRDQLWLTGRDEPVEVNQRALIDKVLARYSGEFTLFRELLQNSDDARSRAVEIHFETAAYLERRERSLEANLCVPSLPELKSTSVKQWTFKNNGEVFTEQDWTRLPRIAEGNPGPEKIGAFGVGFYSLFSVTDCPFVSSGGHGMQFFWKDNKNQLYVRRGDLPVRDSPDPWTTFEMPLREASPIPPALEFMRFLASSITFMVNLREVCVFFDEHCIGRIRKFPGTVHAVGVPEELKRSSPLDIMNVKEIQCHPITIEAEAMEAVFTWGEVNRHAESRGELGGSFCSSQSPPKLKMSLLHRHGDPMRLHRTTVDLTVFTAEVKVKRDDKLSAELFRCTKKEPPSQIKYSLIYTGKDEYDRSVADQDAFRGICDSIFQGLRADLNGAIHTRIFIGHATGQTTGIGGHMASYFIPTVERESIDLVDRNIAIWNAELLYVGGFLSRVVYDLELSKIRTAWERAADCDGTTPDFRPSAELQEMLRQQFLHVLKFFTFHHSTPSSKVGRLLEVAFYRCSSVPLRFLSSAGIRFAPEIRECDLNVTTFLKYLPMLPHYVAQECPRIVEALPDGHKIPAITLSDILEDLQKHALNQEELSACLGWWTARKDVSPQGTTRLLSAITIYDTNGSPLQLSSVKYFIGDSLKARIPLDGPLPASLMPHDVTKKFNPTDLITFGWKELTIVDWLQHISRHETMSADSKYNFTQSIEWAERVLSVLSGAWSPQSDNLGLVAKSIFMGKNCIPTSHGLRPPEESFISSTHTSLFRGLGLPIVRLTTGSEIKGDTVAESLLTSIGVRKHVPPQLLLDKMVETGNWSIPDLISYLVQVQNTLTQEEFSRLESFPCFTVEGTQADVDERPRYRAFDLYPPLDIFRQLQLPVIDWGDKWQNESDQAELLYRLGLHRHMPLDELVILSGNAPDVTVRETAFKYLCDTLRLRYSHYNPDNFRHIAFIPAENEDGACLAKLGDVFLSPRWKTLGFAVIQDSYRKAPVTELGVQQHPPTSMLIQLLETMPPTNEDTARRWFECLCECISSFSQRELTRLSELPIVPVRSPTGWQQLAPSRCYLGDGMRDDFHANLFVFVDFGSTANRFLRACGSKNEPSVKDIAESLVEDPKRFYNLAGDHDGFLAELRDLASQSRRIPNITLSKMMSQPILLGIRRKRLANGGEYEYERALRKPGEIVIADDINSYQLFGDTIFVAPQDVPGLESFYLSLGCQRLSTIVEEKYKASNEISDPETSAEIRSLILERLPLFPREDIHTQFQDPSSLLKAENFNVKICQELAVSKTLAIGDNQPMRSQNVWAATKRDEEGRIELWLSGNAEPDMYEIATSLCRLLFGTVRVSDTLLLATILSTPLEILKRRGYNVDKIARLGHCGPEKPKPPEEVVNSPYRTPGVTTIPLTDHVSEQSVMTIGPSTAVASPASSTHRLIPSSSGISSRNTPSPSVDQPSITPRSSMQNFTRRLLPRGRAPETIGAATRFNQLSRTPRQVIPQSYIRANVGKAMKACKPEGARLLHHRNKVDEIREFPSGGYCDLSGLTGKLKPRGKIGHVKVFTTEDVPDPDTFMTSMHNLLTRFVQVLKAVAEFYELSMTHLHVFYDVAGGPIAFNRDGRIFLNLKYFEAWHDQDVQKGDLQQAQISWFLALAHELAHNLIKEHNSEHEFWFAAICEVYVPRLLKHTPV